MRTLFNSDRLTLWLPLMLATLLAIAFRFPALDSIPPGLNFDEGGEGIAALDVSQGIFKVMWPIGGWKEPLMAYLVQPLFWIFGPTRLALRLYTALWGTGAVLATYFLARQVWLAENDESRNKTMTTWLPAFAALGLATAFWHVAYSRIAFRALSNPAVEALALGFFWRALRTNRRRDFLFAGFFSGGLIYTYQAGRFVPLGVALFLGLEALIAWQQGHRPLFIRYGSRLVVLLGMALLVFSPVGIFFWQNPAAFIERGSAVSIFNPMMNQGDFWGTLWRTTVATLGTFVSLAGDPNELGNIPGLPELNPLLAIFFVLGVATAGYHWRRRPYLFLLSWWPVMLLPAILAPESAPHHLRLIGTAPGAYIFVALGLGTFITFITNILVSRLKTEKAREETTQKISLAHQWQNRLSWLLVLLVFGWTAGQTYHNYFNRWLNEVDHYMAFDMYAVELAEQMAANTDPDLAYVIPMDLRAAHEARHYSLDFLYRGQTPFSYLVVDEWTIGAALTAAAQGKERLGVIRWSQDKHREADAKGLVTFLLGAAGAVLIDQTAHPVYTVETYQLPATDTQFTLPLIEHPIDITLDNLIQIRRAFVSSQVAPGQPVAVGVTYARIAPTAIDYKASLRLVSSDGVTIAQQDRLLQHNWHQGTSLWPAEEVNEYYLLSPPSDILAGDYEVRVVVYHPETQAPLTQNGLVEVILGPVTVPDGE